MSTTHKAMRKPKGRLHRLLLDSFFPLTFLLRNLATLQTEAAFKRLPHGVRKTRFQQVIAERSLFFREIQKWRFSRRPAGPETREHRGETCVAVGQPSEYCTHCGGCCEISSGLQDFSLTEGIPASWLEVFGEGLGRGHHFCAFLLEERAFRRSLCAIHLWRPNPCRAFEQDECEYLMQDQAFSPPWSDERLSVARRRLVHLIDGRKLPGRCTDFPAKRPKFLKFYGV